MMTYDIMVNRVHSWFYRLFNPKKKEKRTLIIIIIATLGILIYTVYIFACLKIVKEIIEEEFRGN